MTREEALDLITPRQFAEELQGLDPANMEFIKFEIDVEKVIGKFRMFNPVFLKKLSTQNETVYETLMCNDLTVFQKFEYLKRLEMYDSRNNVYDHYEKIPLVYKKNNICRFNYIYHEYSNPNRKVFIK